MYTLILVFPNNFVKHKETCVEKLNMYVLFQRYRDWYTFILYVQRSILTKRNRGKQIKDATRCYECISISTLMFQSDFIFACRFSHFKPELNHILLVDGSEENTQTLDIKRRDGQIKRGRREKSCQLYIQMWPRSAIGPAGKKDKNSIKRVSPASEMSQAHHNRGRSIDFINIAVLKIDRSNFIFRLDYSYHYRCHAAAAVYFCGITFKMEIVILLVWPSVCNK